MFNETNYCDTWFGKLFWGILISDRYYSIYIDTGITFRKVFNSENDFYLQSLIN